MGKNDKAEAVIEDAPEAPAETQEVAVEVAPVEAVPFGGILERVPQKPDVSHGALQHLLATGGEITHDLIDEIEKKGSVGDVKFLAAFCHKLLGDEG